MTAREHPTWEYVGVRGALRNLDHKSGRTTIRRIVAVNEIKLTARRRRGMSRKTFLRVHWGAITASGFCTVEALTRAGLVRFLVFLVIDLKRRRVKIAGTAPDPDGGRMTQMARNLTDGEDGFRVGTRYLIHERDVLFTTEPRQILRAGGVKTVRLPAQSPDLNAYAERFVRSIRKECLTRVIPLGEKHFCWVIGECGKHYHLERNHPGFGNELIQSSDEPRQGRGACRGRLGGLLRPYYRRAA